MNNGQIKSFYIVENFSSIDARSVEGSSRHTVLILRRIKGSSDWGYAYCDGNEQGQYNHHVQHNHNRRRHHRDRDEDDERAPGSDNHISFFNKDGGIVGGDAHSSRPPQERGKSAKDVVFAPHVMVRASFKSSKAKPWRSDEESAIKANKANEVPADAAEDKLEMFGSAPAGGVRRRSPTTHHKKN
jgi:hypothetical protein